MTLGSHLPNLSATMLQSSSSEVEDDMVNGLLVPSAFLTTEGILNTIAL
jgi:hypothetical protein